MKKVFLFIGLAAISVSLFLGCGKATLESGGAYAPANTNVVDTAVAVSFYNTDLSYKVAWSAINTVFEFERNNRALLWNLSPNIKKTLDEIRPQAVAANAKYLAARQAYLDTPDQPGLDILHTILADLQKLVASVQVVLPAATLQTKG